MNNEDNANDEMTNGTNVPLFKLQQEIHDSHRDQNPYWIEPDGDCPTRESNETRLAELLGFASPRGPR
jgi:hypothetical protein